MEMMLEGKDVLLFRVEVSSPSRSGFWSGSYGLTIFSLTQSVPSHRSLHKEAETLLHFLQLPAFPPISRVSPLHPALLSLRYLRDANLPGNRQIDLKAMLVYQFQVNNTATRGQRSEEWLLLLLLCAGQFSLFPVANCATLPPHDLQQYCSAWL